MEYHRLGYFVVTADEEEELAACYARWNASVDGMHDDMQVRTNELYRRAQDRAVSQWRFAHPLAYDADSEVLSYLRHKVGTDTVMIGSRDCPRVARDIDELVARRGGQDALIAHLTKLALGRVPGSLIREVYIAFRTSLRTAIELRAALVCTDYRPGAESELAAKRACESPRMPSNPTELLDVAFMTEDELRAFGAWRSTEEHAWTHSWTEHRLYLVPAPYIDEIMALARQCSALYDEDPDGNWEQYLQLANRAQTIGYEEWERWLELRFRGQISAWELLYAALDEFCPGCLPDSIAFSPAEVRRLYEIFIAWQERAGGRRTAVAALAERAYGRDREMTERTYDALLALFRHGAAAGCGLIDSPVYEMG